MDKLADTRLVNAALDALRPLGLQGVVRVAEPPLVGARADALVRLRFGGLDVDYAVAVKRQLRPGTLGPALHQLARYTGNTLLVTDHVTPPMADELRARGVEFIDTAGNAYLHQPPLLVWVKGQRPPEAPGARAPMGRAFQTTGLQVVFTLLCKPEAVTLPYRELAAMAGVAHGTVGWVMPELPQLGFVIEVNRTRRLVDGERLLKLWVDAYLQKLRTKLLLGRYQANGLAWTTAVDATDYGLLLGGEPAAERMTHTLRPGTATFYGEKIPPQLVIDQRLRPDAEGNVEILKRFWTFETARTGLVPDVLIYADLLATGDARCLEAAQDLYGGIVARFK